MTHQFRIKSLLFSIIMVAFCFHLNSYRRVHKPNATQYSSGDQLRFDSTTPLIVYRLNNGRIVLEEDPLTKFEGLGPSLETTDRSSADANAWAKLQLGVKHWQSLEKSKAISVWQTVVQQYSVSEPAFAALVNVGHGLRDLGKMRAAIEAYQAAIDMDLLSQVDSKHYVCINLSHTFFECQDLANAVQYARLARNTYQSGSCFCSICNDLDNARIDRYIEQIQLAIEEKRSVRLEDVNEWNARW